MQLIFSSMNTIVSYMWSYLFLHRNIIRSRKIIDNSGCSLKTNYKIRLKPSFVLSKEEKNHVPCRVTLM